MTNVLDLGFTQHFSERLRQHSHLGWFKGSAKQSASYEMLLSAHHFD